MQKLWETACSAFPQKGQLHSASFQSLRTLLATTNPEEYGIQKSSSLFSAFRRNPSVSMIPLRYSDNLHISCFVIPKGGCLPLHDHPQMTILCKLLYGKIRLRVYDWEQGEELEEERKAIGQIRKARLVADEILSDSREEDLHSVKMVWPDKGNVHSLDALEDSAIIDILAPPYDPPLRSCHYYKEEGKLEGEGGVGSVVLLKEIDCPSF